MFLKTYTLFASSYYTVDPIVFLIKTSYRLNITKKYNNESIKNGNIFIINPKIYFAVNPYTSINWAIKYQYKNKNRLNGKILSNNESSISYMFGVDYEINSKYNMSFNFEKKNTTDYSISNIDLSLSYKF